MARRNKVILAYIANASKRRASYKKRSQNLIKKVSELSTLCGVQACAIIRNPFDHQFVVWPSHEGVMAAIARYRSLSQSDKTRKMFNEDIFNHEGIQKLEEELCRMREENKRKELEIFLARCILGKVSVSDLEMTDYANMKQVIQNFLEDLHAKYEKSGSW